jgi:uncharacterized protein YqhQ
VSEPVRLGGMALANGVLVHGPRHWACAIRTGDGRLEVAAERKTIRSVDVRSPLLRGPARVAEVLALIPAIRRALPEAELPFLERRTLALMAGTSIAVRALRGSGLSVGAQEVAAAALAVVPALAAVRGTPLAAYHGAEHISIGSYEHGEPRPREHERCGSHMLGPLLVTTALGNAAASRIDVSPAARTLARTGIGIASIAVAGEILAWVVQHPENPVARALAWPGRELQSRFLTAEPTPDQIEVAQAALAECIRRELAEADRPSGRD